MMLIYTHTIERRKRFFVPRVIGSGPPHDRTIRETELKSVSTGLYAFMAVVAVLGILLGIGFLLINFLYRERR